MKIDENTTPLLTVDHLKQYFKVSGSRRIRFRKIHNRTKHYPSV